MNIFTDASFWISAVAMIFSYLGFRRGRRLENENFLFQKRFLIYAEILGKLERLNGFLYERIQLVNKITSIKDNPEELKKIANEIDNAIYEFGYLLTDNILLIEEKVEEKLNELVMLFYETDEEITIENYSKYKMRIDEITSELEQIMRFELKLDVLNKKLKIRMGPTIFGELLPK